jgi:hypothetical protein
LTNKEVKIQNYYFFGVSKTIPIGQILEIKLYKLTIWLKYRLAGGSYKYLWHYFPFDIRRKDKDKFVAIYLDALWKPCITPERPDEFFAALAKIVPKSTDMIEKGNGELGGESHEEMSSLKQE